MDIHDIFVASPDYIQCLKTLNENDYDLVKQASFMLLDGKNSTRHYINNYLNINGITLQNTIEVTTMDLLIEFARIGLGVACVIKEFVKDDLDTGKLVEVDLSMSIPKRVVGFAYNNNNPNPTLHNFLRIK